MSIYKKILIAPLFLAAVLILVGIFTNHAFAGSATLTWNTNTESDLASYKIYYGTSARTGTDPKTCGLCGYSTSINVGKVTTYTFSSLTDGLTYYFSISALDTSNNESTFSSEVSKVILVADTTPPTISSVSASSITSSGAAITWTTNEASDSQVEYGLTTSYGSQTTLNTSMVTSHSQSLTGLSTNTLYHYRVKSKDAASNLATSGDYTFTTTTGVTYITNLNFTPSLEGVSASGKTFTITIYQGTTQVAQFSVQPVSGQILLPTGTNLASGTYNLTTDAQYYLRARQNNISLASNSTVTLSILKAGDINNDSIVNSLDWSAMNSNWWSSSYPSDINQDGVVNSVDFSWMNKNWLLADA